MRKKIRSKKVKKYINDIIINAYKISIILI